MKKLKACSALLALLILLFSALSCGKEEKKAWLTYKDQKITEQVYRYWLSSVKNKFVSSYEDVTDTLECWNRRTTDVDGNSVTWGEYVGQYAMLYAKNMLIELKLFEDRGLSLTDEEEEKIDKYINELIYYRAGDSRSKFNEELKSVYGISTEDFKEALEIESKVAKLEEYFLSDAGGLKASSEEIEDYFQEHFVRIQVLLIYTDAEYELDEKGAVAYDEAGQPKVKKYTEAEKEEKRNKARAVEALAQQGEDFGSLVEHYGELQNRTHPNGFYFSDEDLYSLAADKHYDINILRAIVSQKVGSVARYETEGEAIFLVKKLELIPGAYLLEEEKDQFENLQDQVTTQKFRGLIEPELEKVTVSEEAYDLKIVDINRGVY